MDKKEFIDILEHAWREEGRRFSKEEQSKYLEWLSYLQTAGTSLELNRTEIKILYHYIYKTIQAYIKHSRKLNDIDPNILAAMHNIYFIMEYLFVYQSEIISVDLLLELFYSLIEIEEEDTQKIEFLMSFYKESELLNKLCFYLFYYFDFKCEEQIIQTFLSKIQFTESYYLFYNTLYQMI